MCRSHDLEPDSDYQKNQEFLSTLRYLFNGVTFAVMAVIALWIFSWIWYWVTGSPLTL